MPPPSSGVTAARTCCCTVVVMCMYYGVKFSVGIIHMHAVEVVVVKGKNIVTFASCPFTSLV
jgi:hypothetical protein